MTARCECNECDKKPPLLDDFCPGISDGHHRGSIGSAHFDPECQICVSPLPDLGDRKAVEKWLTS